MWPGHVPLAEHVGSLFFFGAGADAFLFVLKANECRSLPFIAATAHERGDMYPRNALEDGRVAVYRDTRHSSSVPFIPPQLAPFFSHKLLGESAMCLIGLDIGTTGVKALAFAENGECLSSAYHEYPLSHPEPSWSEIRDVDMRRGIDEVLGGLDPAVKKTAAALAVSSQAQAVVPLDRDGKALADIIVTFDGRTVPQYQWWREHYEPAELFRRTGVPLSSIYTLNKIMWYRDNRPDIYRRAWKFCCVQDYAHFLLGGETRIDHSLAGRTMMSDPAALAWNREMLRRADIDEDKLSIPVESAAVVGCLRRDAAARLGLPRDLVLVAGGHDQCCGAFGAGVDRPGRALNATGTIDALVAVIPELRLDDAMFAMNMCCYPYVNPGSYAVMAINPNGGLLFKWYKDTFAGEEAKQARAAGRDVYTDLIMDAAEKPSDIFVLPHLEGAGTPILDPESLGAIVGLRVSHRKSDICRGVLDSIAYDMRQNLDAMRESGVAIEQIHAIGGGAKTPRWLQIKADIFGLPIVTLRVNESAALGAAMLAGVGTGVFSSAAEASAAMVAIQDEFRPNPAMRGEYEERYQTYRSLYPTLKGFNHRLSQRLRARKDV